MGRNFSQTIQVDVDIDNSVLEENGYHHEEDCTSSIKEREIDENRKALEQWHDLAHGLMLWASCHHEPCSLLTDDFRSRH